MISNTINLYKNAYSGLTRRMWLLAAVMLINRCGTMVLPFMTLYCNHLGYTATQGGLAVAIYGVGSLFGAFIGGRLSDKLGFYYVQFAALLGGGIMFIVLGQMDSYVSICICIFFASFINEAFRPANSSAVAHYSTVQSRTQSFSLVRLAINLGWGVGSALAGILASISYELLFWVDGITNIVAGFVLLLILPKVSLAQQHKSHLPKPGKVRGPFQDRTFMIFTGFMLLFAFCFFQLFTTVPLYFKEGLKLDEFWIGVIMSMNGIVIALFEMVIVFKLEGTKPYLKLMMYGTLLLALSYCMLNIPLANGFVLASAVIFMVTIAEITGMPFMNSYYIARTTTENRGQYAAIYTMAWSVAQVTGSLSGTQIAHSLGYNYLWWILGAICLITALGFKYLHARD
ncbi:MFS transporter [Ferruginibacter sp.]|nr:MFS transporter [Ferruginibacter sp.]